MEPSIPFASSYYSNSLHPWHHGGYLDDSFYDDSGYASEDSALVPFSSVDPTLIYKDTDQDYHDSPRTRRHRAAAFVSAQWSPPAASRACHLHSSINDSRRSYDLPRPLSFESQPNYRGSEYQREPSTTCSRENFGRDSGHTTSQWDFEENISPLAFEEHRARIPDTLPSLSNRIDNETDHSSPCPSSVQHGSPSPEVTSRAPQTRNPTRSAQSDYKSENSMHSSTGHPPQKYTSSRDAQLAAAWQQLYHERTELEKEKRALRKKKKCLLQRMERRRSSRRAPWDDTDGDDHSGFHGTDRMVEGDESAG